MIRIGVFGAGRFGNIHMNILKEIAEFEIAGFYDPDQEKAAKTEKETGLKRFISEEELIDASQAIDIVSSTPSHFNLAQKALKKSKHLFIEKPVTSTTEEAKTLLSFAAEAGVKVQVGHVERFNPAFINAHDYILNPMFIESHRLMEFENAKKDVSVLDDLMVHDIDILLQIVKSPIKKISANSVGILNGTPDIVSARIEFDNGCVANLTASRLAVKNMRITRIYQKDASISINFLDNKTGLIKQNEETGIKLELPEIKSANAIKDELTRFSYAINNNSEPAVTLDHAIQALAIAGMIQDKLKPQSNYFSDIAIS
ncbi:MAG: Gfo/Idh/MocA family oxidoreductase [Bacteroidia bacterium]|nr:Gfo/Idh/MocA family oxidoreductase [Bacteroidia bacterium]